MFLRNQVICLKNWKLWRGPTLTWKFFILFRTWVIFQNKKNLASKHLHGTGLPITQDLNKIEKHPKHSSVGIGKTETCAKFKQKKKKNSMAVGARQNFQFFRKITWFHRNQIPLFRFKYLSI